MVGIQLQALINMAMVHQKTAIKAVGIGLFAGFYILSGCSICQCKEIQISSNGFNSVRPTVIVQQEEIEMIIGDRRLFWMKCSEGMKWDGEKCTGESKIMVWEKAQRACPVGYRLPSYKEMIMIMNPCMDIPDAIGKKAKQCTRCADNDICYKLFYSTVWDQEKLSMHYWCNELDADAIGAWWVHVDWGQIRVSNPNGGSGVRCVRDEVP